MSSQLKDTWDSYYKNASGPTVLKDEAFFKMEVKAILDECRQYIRENASKSLKIVELGSGLGGLAKELEKNLGSELLDQYSYIGIDFSEPAVQKSKDLGLRYSDFLATDFMTGLREIEGKPDIIVTQRSVMALMEQEAQAELLKQIRSSLKPGGLAVLSEGTQKGLKGLKELRAQLGVSSDFDKVWHSEYLDDALVMSLFDNRVEVKDYSSIYWLITRVIYPYFQEPKHNSAIHSFASGLPQTGDFGLVKLFVCRA